MAVSAPMVQHSSDPESTSSPEAGSSRGFVAVNHASGNESDSSSRLSSPHETTHRGSGHSSQTPSSSYRAYQAHELAKNKRKRSESDEASRYSEQQPGDYSPPKRVEPQHMADRALHVLGHADHHEGPYYASTNGEPNGPSWNSERLVPSQHHMNGMRAATTPEAHLAEVLPRENSGQDADPRPWDLTGRPNGEPGHETYSGSSPVNGNNGKLPTKRKRNFSNRTKTGCMTCRRRKKKCDEAHPVCNNCVRGGFQCSGYSVARGMWPSKPAASKAPIPLQSKDGHSDVSESPATYQAASGSPSSNRPSMPYEGGQMRPISVDDHDGPQQQQQQQQQQYASPPPHDPRNRPPYPGHRWPPQHGQPYTSDHLPPLAELGRSEIPTSATSRDMSRPGQQGSAPPQQHPAQPHPPPPHPPPQHPPQQHPPQPHPPPPQPPSTHSSAQGPPLAPPSHNASTQPVHWPPPPQPEYHTAYTPQPVEHHNPTNQMRMSSASFDYHKSGAKTFTVEEVERSRMLRQTRYNHFDPTLVNERQRCERALQRYNYACRLDSGISEDEARNILWQVLDPSRDNAHPFLAPLKERGVLSHGVKVEAPFHCTYGYNLKLMDNVYIGKNCTIDDAGKVEIGARTWIGPNVTILTTDVSKDMVDRKGTAGAWIAAPVFIASEVVIGANAVIYPGVRLERGSTVDPFAVVRESLGENQIQRAPVGPRIGM